MEEPPDHGQPPDPLHERVFDAVEGPAEAREGRLRELEAAHPDRIGEIRRLAERVAFVDDLFGTPQRIGPFRLVRELGSGGMATVHLAERDGWGQEVALKLVAPARLLSARYRELFRREAELAVRVVHPNVCRIYEPGEYHGIPYLAMEYVEGRTLRDEAVALLPGDPSGTQHRPPTDPAMVARFARWIAQAARGAHAAHAVGLVHRDLTPNNVMIRHRDQQAVILDFGLARELASADGTLSPSMTGGAGTPAFAAPEQLVDGPLGAHTDVYGLGATLFWCLAGRPPHDTTSLGTLARHVLDDEPPSLASAAPTVPAPLRAIVRVAMARSPERRYATAADLADDLEHFLAGEPVRARNTRLHEHALRIVRRRPATLALVALCLVSLVAGIGFVRGARASTVRSAESLVAFATSRLDLLRYHVDHRSPVCRERASRLIDTFRMLVQLDGLDADLAAAQGALPADPADRTRAQRALNSGIERVRRQIAEALADTTPTVAGELFWVRNVAEATTPERLRRWRESREYMRTSSLYSGSEVDLVPQTGLVPLGPDPESGLLEFYDLRSAWSFDPDEPVLPTDVPVPERDPRTDRLPPVTAATGIVFVLLPAGHDLPHVVTRWQPDLLTVRLATRPLLIAKHELTRGQWIRLGGSAQDFAIPSEHSWTPVQVDDRHPVDGISYARANEVLEHWGLRLPTGPEWTHAAAADASGWWCGPKLAAFVRAANVADASLAAMRTQLGLDDLACEDWDDGYVLHHPVDAGPANPRGLHGILGNVAELTLDPALGSSRAFVRGGGWRSRRGGTRSGMRRAIPFTGQRDDVGIRPVRDLQRPFAWQQVGRIPDARPDAFEETASDAQRFVSTLDGAAFDALDTGFGHFAARGTSRGVRVCTEASRIYHRSSSALVVLARTAVTTSREVDTLRFTWTERMVRDVGSTRVGARPAFFHEGTLYVGLRDAATLGPVPGRSQRVSQERPVASFRPDWGTPATPVAPGRAGILPAIPAGATIWLGFVIPIGVQSDRGSNHWHELEIEDFEVLLSGPGAR